MGRTDKGILEGKSAALRAALDAVERMGRGPSLVAPANRVKRLTRGAEPGRRRASVPDRDEDRDSGAPTRR